jgi:hypothetical protein
VPVKIAKLQRGTLDGVLRAAERSAAGKGGECNFSKVIRVGFPPCDRNTSSLFWSAKDKGSYRGEKPTANLAAIQVSSREVSFTF